MNIQINCKDTVRNFDVGHIVANLEDIKKEYQETKNDFLHKKYINGKMRWVKELKGTMFEKTDITCIATERTLYFNIK